MFTNLRLITVPALVLSFSPALAPGAMISAAKTAFARTEAPSPGAASRLDETPRVNAAPETTLPNYAEQAVKLRHWRQPEVTFYVTPDPNEKRTPSEDEALVAQGIGLWQEKVKSHLVLRMAKPDETADVEISFVRPGKVGKLQVGYTKVQFTVPQNDIQNATMEIGENLAPEMLVQVVAHECGHALGIQGHSDDKNDLMFPFGHTPAEITERDVNTMNLAYDKIDTSQKARGTRKGQKFGSATSY